MFDLVVFLFILAEKPEVSPSTFVSLQTLWMGFKWLDFMTSWNYHFTVNVLYSVFTMWVQSPVMCPSKLDSAVSFTADRMLMRLPCYVCDFIEHTRANNQTQNLWHCFQHTGNNSKKSVMLRIVVYDNHVSYNAVCSTWLTPRRQLLCL